jgi:hypothetical protein
MAHTREGDGALPLKAEFILAELFTALLCGRFREKVVERHRTIVQSASRTLQPGYGSADGLVG